MIFKAIHTSKISVAVITMDPFNEGTRSKGMAVNADGGAHVIIHSLKGFVALFAEITSIVELGY
jgi:hypothetical protein